MLGDLKVHMFTYMFTPPLIDLDPSEACRAQDGVGRFQEGLCGAGRLFRQPAGGAALHRPVRTGTRRPRTRQLWSNRPPAMGGFVVNPPVLACC